MTRLYGDSKVKRVLAWLLLVSTVLSLFISSNTDTVYADSNSRRRTSINLAAGIGFSDITNFNDIDEVSLQTIAIYLSNFYLPFVTILDGDYTNEGAEDSGNNQHVQAMKDALIRNCGFNKNVAEYIVGYVLNQSLASCKAVYMKTDELRACFELTEYNTGESFLGFSNDGDTFKGLYSGTSARDASYWHDSSIRYTKKEEKAGGIFSRAEYGDWDYILNTNMITVNGVEYSPVSYAIFLGVMQNLCKITYFDDKNVYHLNEAWTFKRAHKLYADLGYSVAGSFGGTELENSQSEIDFYTAVTSGDSVEMRPVFGNSEYCLAALLQAMQYCDLNNGFGSGFSSISSPEIESINNADVTQYALVTCPNIYVNWEGSLIYDNGVYRTIILPGCMNPYMVLTIGSNGLEYPRMNYVNNISLTSIADGTVDSNHRLSFSADTVKNYRVTIGSNSYKFDASWKPGSWGENESIADLLASIDYVTTKASFGSDDKARFPYLTLRVPDSWVLSTSNKKFYKTTFGVSSNESSSIVWYDSFAPITDDTILKDLFPDTNAFKLVSELQKFNVDTYAQFKNIKTQGHALSYPKSTQKLFQNIYLTYCFAAFNATDSSTFGSADKNKLIVRARLNFDNFPAGNVDIEWASIQQDQLANEVMSFVYYLLHPTEGIGYVVTLFKNKMSGILLGWHEDIVGATSSNAATGMTKYLGTSSYTTMPNLGDISWVAGILNIYNNIVVYLIIVMCLILLCYVLTGSMTVQRGIVGVVLFGICAFLPPFAINAAVDTINTTSDAIFSKKFDFWAICQMQNFVEQYKAAMEAQGNGDFASYAAFVLSTQKSDLAPADSDDEASASYSGTKLKWMAPKKYNSLASLVQAVNEGTAMGNSSANFLRSSILNMVAKSTSGETFLADTESLYLYRDYSDIFKYAHTSYNILSKFNFGGDLGKSGTGWTDVTRPLAVYVSNFSSSSYYRAWYEIAGKEPLYEFIEVGTYHLLDETAKSETSSISHISKGYLYNTINFNPSTSRNTYFWTKSATTDGKPTHNTLAVSYLANYTQTYREVKDGYNRLLKVIAGTPAQVGDPTSPYYNFGLAKANKESSVNGSYMKGYQEIIGFAEPESTLPTEPDKVATLYKDLSDIFYGLYTESPFYFFNANVRDQANASAILWDNDYKYDYDDLTRGMQSSSDGKMNSIAQMFLHNNQEYFFNLEDNAGDGYGELRDFMNMHDLFYFVIPYLRDGVELARLYDDVFGLYVDDDCSLIVNADGSCMYDGQSFKDLTELKGIIDGAGGKYNDEELYKLWHSYNTYTILSAYSPWIDTMMDCDYAKSEVITVMGDRFRVNDPLNPRTYYETDASGRMTGGRYMIFSRSEMNAMGLTTADLTTVERKIIALQDNVYAATLDLMNYYTFSDEVMIQAYAMLQTFEFNKIFSQTSLIKDGYVMYPQGYELKAFSYDAYLRMIISGASGESLMFNGDTGNVSIYERVMKNTSLFFGIFLLINDILAVYVIPGLKIFFLVTIFFCSVLILVGAVVKMEMNILSVLWKSLFAPLLSFSAICIGMSLIVSMFMSNGASGVTKSEFTINVGDPTSAVILMIILNVLVVVLMFKICKKCFRDLITYAKAVFDNIGSTVVGAVGGLAAGFAGGRAMDKFVNGSGGNGVSRTAKQRGRDNDPKSGRSGIGVGGALAAGAAGAGMAAGAMHAGTDTMSENEKRQLEKRKQRDDDMVGMNKYDKKAYEGAAERQDKAQAKADRLKTMSEGADKGARRARLEAANARAQKKANTQAIKADNIKKYGSGVRGRFENLKTSVGVGRADRLKQLGIDSASENVRTARDNGKNQHGVNSRAAFREKRNGTQQSTTNAAKNPNAPVAPKPKKGAQTTKNAKPKGKVTDIGDYKAKRSTRAARTKKAAKVAK